MKKILFCLCGVMAMVLASCGGKGTSLEDMLQTIPKDSKGFAVLNLKSLNDKLKADNADQSLQSLINGAVGNQMPKELKNFLGEDSPVDFEGPMVVFETNQNPVISFYVKDEKDFRDMLEKEFDIKLKKNDGIYEGREEDTYIYQKDKQVWICPGTDLSAKDIKKLYDQKEDDSVLSYPAIGKVMESDADMIGMANLAELKSMRVNRDFSQMMAGLNLVFDDPDILLVSANFDNGKATSTVGIYTAKGEPSKFAFQPAQINMQSLQSFPGKGDVFAAIGIDSQFMNTILSKIDSFIYDREQKAILASLQGNIVFSMDLSAILNGEFGLAGPRYDYAYDYDEWDDTPLAVDSMKMAYADTVAADDIFAEPYPSTRDYNGPAFTVQAGFKSPSDAQRAANYINGQMNSTAQTSVNVEGSNLIISAGTQSGASIGKVASLFNGAYGGMVSLTENIKMPQVQMVSDLVKSFSIMLKPEGNGITINTQVETKEGQNALVTFFRLGAMAASLM